MTLDETDRKLLSALQADARLSNQQLGELLHLSPSQAGRRRQALESRGVVAGYRAELDANLLGLSVQAFVQVSMGAHSRDAVTDFLRFCQASREIVSVWTLTGDADYLLRVYCRDLGRLNLLLQNELLAHDSVARVHSQVVLEQMQQDSALPL